MKNRLITKCFAAYQWPLSRYHVPPQFFKLLYIYNAKDIYLSLIYILTQKCLLCSPFQCGWGKWSGRSRQ